MNRLIAMTVLKFLAQGILFTSVIALAIMLIGRANAWDSRTTSNAFFVAGCLVFIAGASSRMAAGQHWGVFQQLDAESFRGMNSAERADFILKASSPIRLLLLGLVSGLLLCLISVLVTRLP